MYDIPVLKYIQVSLGFGSIIKQGETTYRYVGQDKLGLMLIGHIINGNVVFPIRRAQYVKF